MTIDCASHTTIDSHWCSAGTSLPCVALCAWWQVGPPPDTILRYGTAYLQTLCFICKGLSTYRRSGQDLEHGGDKGPRTCVPIHYTSGKPCRLSNVLVFSIYTANVRHSLDACGTVPEQANMPLAAFPAAASKNSINLHALYLQLSKTPSPPHNDSGMLLAMFRLTGAHNNNPAVCGRAAHRSYACVGLPSSPSGRNALSKFSRHSPLIGL